MPAIDGSTYLKRMSELKAEIWIDGKKITGNICDHLAFKGILKSKAKLFDLQLSKEKKDTMTFTSPLTGNRVGSTYIQPFTKEDLEKRRLTTQEWAKTTGGMMGRAPDYMNTGIMALGTASNIFQDKHNLGINIKNIFENARENDLTFAHTFINPQVNRSVGYVDDNNNPIFARVVKKNSDGIVIKGAKLLATQGGITDQLLVLPVGGRHFEEPCLYAFSIPSNTPNLRFICREPFTYRSSVFDHPLGSRFEEMDTVVVFDYVFVPWDRVFFYNDLSVMNHFYEESNFHTFLLHQAVSRQMIKTQFLLGVAQLIVEAIDITDYQHVKDKVSEIIRGYETIKALLLSSEIEAKVDKRGTMVPNSDPLYVATTTFSQLYPRMVEILELLGASGLVSIPTEQDFDSEIQADLNQYLQGASLNAKERTKIFRLAWDVALSAFGGRQRLYERFFFGDPVKLNSILYNSYSKDSAVALVNHILNEQSQ